MVGDGVDNEGYVVAVGLSFDGLPANTQVELRGRLLDEKADSDRTDRNAVILSSRDVREKKPGRVISMTTKASVKRRHRSIGPGAE